MRRTPKRRKPDPPVLEDPEDPGPQGPFRYFYENDLIVGEPIVVKSGKEATVYCCQAHPSVGRLWLAAKVYRPREQRAFKNDAV